MGPDSAQTGPDNAYTGTDLENEPISQREGEWTPQIGGDWGSLAAKLWKDFLQATNQLSFTQFDTCKKPIKTHECKVYTNDSFNTLFTISNFLLILKR